MCFEGIEPNDLGSRVDEFLVVPDVVRMMMSIEDVLDRLIGDGLDLLHNSGIRRIAGIFSVHDDQPFVRDSNDGIRSRTSDHIKTRLHLLDLFHYLRSTAASRPTPLRGLSRQGCETDHCDKSDDEEISP